ncbi:hypothetical protein GUI43_05352 [Micromonospora noduli]|nr:hypothetical protein GUI43_05352 [Micromonospora noduli]
MRAARRGAALGAGDRREVAAAGHLHQHRQVLAERVAGSRPGQAGQPGGGGPGVAGQLRVVPGRRDGRDPGPHGGPVGDHLRGPAGLHQQLRLGRPGVPTDQRAGLGEVGAGEQHVAGVRVGRPGLGVQVVTVVPDGDEAEPGHRGEHRRPGADHHRHLATASGEEGPVPPGRAERGGEADVPSRAEHAGERGVETVEVTRVGHHHHRAAPTGDGGRHRVGVTGRPVLTGQRRPDRAGRPAVGERPQQGRTGRVVAPPARVDRLGGGRRGGLLVAGLLLHPGVPGWHGEPEHVGEAARVPVGDRSGQPGDLGGKHRLRGDHLLQVREAAGVPGVVGA